MPDIGEPMSPMTMRRVLLGVLLSMLLLLCAVVLRPFAAPVVWAVILAYISWPAYRRIRQLCQNRQTLASLLMTLIVALVLILPVVWLAALLQEEIAKAYQSMLSYYAEELETQATFLQRVPWIGDALGKAYIEYAADPLQMRELLLGWVQRFRAELLGVAGGVGRSLVKLFLAITTLFFLYRDGERLVHQAAQLQRRYYDERLDRYVRAAGAMTRAVIFGLLVTAVVQGTIGGIGCAVFGVGAPVLLGVLTGAASILPVVGTALIWGPAGLWLALSGHLWQGVGLLAWGALLVHPADNVIRPLLISNATQLPFLLVMFGVFGGLAAFGLVGMFIGPVVLAVAAAAWREWVH